MPAKPYTYNDVNLVLIRDLRIDMSIGVYDFEKVKPQPVVINLTAVTQKPDEISNDNIQDVVSYEDIIKDIEGLSKQGHIHLVETFAEEIASSCLKDDRIHQVTIRIEKPDIFEHAAGVGVEITRSRI